MRELLFYPLNITITDLIQVFLLYFILYYIAKSIYKTRAWVLVKGLLGLAIIYGIFWVVNFDILNFILQSLVNVLLIAIIIMFQPQLQQFVEKVGSTPLTELLKRKEEVDKYCSDNTVNEILQACEVMSEAKTGALIVIERKIPLIEYADTGIKLDSVVSKELLINIFEKNTPLHDGAVIIRNDRVISATCYLPLSQSKTISKDLGTRHRAAIGISEDTDAIVIVVSEETGKMSLCVGGKIQEVKQSRLSTLLTRNNKIIKKTDYHTSMKFKGAVMLGAVFLWAFVLVTSDPVVTKTFDRIPVEIQNEHVLSDINKYYTIKKGKNVQVRVSSRRSQLGNIKRDDITATANMENLSLTYGVPIEIGVANSDIQYEILGNDILSVAIEDGKQIEQEININQTGLGKEDMYLKGIELENNNVVISGPKSLIDTLDKAVINVDLDNPKAGYKISVFDRNGTDITEKVEMNIDFVQAKISYLPIKPINLIVHIDKNTIEQEILVAGENLSSFNQLEIELEIPNQDAKTYILDVQKHLPENIYYAGKEKVELNLEEVIEND